MNPELLLYSSTERSQYSASGVKKKQLSNFPTNSCSKSFQNEIERF